MTAASLFAAREESSAITKPEEHLRSRAWDRIFIAGGVWLVPIPILAFYLFRWLGATVAASEDLVTLLVMLPLGGPHVFATYTRTFFNPAFRRQDKVLFGLAFVVAAIVIGAAVSSAFFDVVLGGSPPIRYVLTFFFFWAGVHIVQQNSYIANAYAAKAGNLQPVLPRAFGLVDYAVMLLAMYPLSIFRMSMVDLGDPTMRAANPDALATQIVVALAGSQEAADAYVFRIGRVAPILPDFMMHPAMWIGITALFALAVLLFVYKSIVEKRAGALLPHRFALVVGMATFGFAVPLLPNLDSAFQGMNAWHSFQYLGLLWLMNRRSQDRGEIRSKLFERTMGEGRHWRFYGTAVGATLGLLALVVIVALAIERFSGGTFVLFGHDNPQLDEAGNQLYRPGAILLAYYMVAFSLLLVHYLHDGVFFFRRRYLVDGATGGGSAA